MRKTYAYVLVTKSNKKNWLSYSFDWNTTLPFGRGLFGSARLPTISPSGHAHELPQGHMKINSLDKQDKAHYTKLINRPFHIHRNQTELLFLLVLISSPGFWKIPKETHSDWKDPKHSPHLSSLYQVSSYIFPQLLLYVPYLSGSGKHFFTYLTETI